MKSLSKMLLPLIFGLLTLNGPLQAQDTAKPTRLVVRAKAKDAKFIGSSMDGALILVKNAVTGELLARGYTRGSTGDTDRLVKQPHDRYEQLSTEDAAKFETTLQLDQPVFVTVEAIAPQAQQQSRVSSSTQLWLIPGKDITGDGIILEVPGFSVDVVKPRAHEFAQKGPIDIQANVVMMCGCPTSEGGLWDSSQFEVKALIRKDGQTIDEIPLSYTGTTSLYSASWSPEETGAYDIEVYAYDSRTANTGLDKATVVIQ